MGALRHARLELVVVAMIFAAKLLLAAEPNDGSTASSTAKPGARVLFVTQSFEFKHDVVNRKESQKSVAERTMEELGIGSNVFRCDSTQDVAKDLTKENLQNYDILMFYTTGHRAKWPLDDATLDYIFKDWVKQKGHGFIGVHSAADTLEDYEPYWEMLGGSFNAHPWTANSHVTVVVDDPQHPIAKPWGQEFQIKDEIYQFKHWQPEKVRVLMSLDIGRSDFNTQVRDNIKQFHVPIAWCKEYSKRRVFYTSLGHREDVWTPNTPENFKRENPKEVSELYQKHILGGIRWALGLEDGDAKPQVAPGI